MRVSLNIMKNAVEKAVQEDIKSMGGLIGGEAKKLTNLKLYFIFVSPHLLEFI